MPAGLTFPAVLGSKPENIKKNRFKNIIACELIYNTTLHVCTNNKMWFYISSC